MSLCGKRWKTHKAFFFFNLEKRNYKKRTITELQIEWFNYKKWQASTCDYKRLKTIIPSYTNRLVAHPQNVSMTLLKVWKSQNGTDKKRDGIEGPPTDTEILNTFPTDKTPREDGFIFGFVGRIIELATNNPKLNVGCKIATKAIAKRIEPLLPNLVYTDQTLERLFVMKS